MIDVRHYAVRETLRNGLEVLIRALHPDDRRAVREPLPLKLRDELFREDALGPRTLTKLQHEALVQYRVLAQEPQLDPTKDVLGNVMVAVQHKKALVDRFNRKYAGRTTSERASC